MTDLPAGVTVPSVVAGQVTAVEGLRHHTGNAATGGIWRVRTAEGSAVLKLARPPRRDDPGWPGWHTSDEPAHWNYWRRESLAYATGLAAQAYAGAGITPPELLEVQELPDGSVALWLADAAGSPGTAWSVARLGSFARQLGRAQSRWVERVPQHPWLSRDWLGGYLADRPVPDDVPWDHPVTRFWPDRLRAVLPRVWRDRDRLLTIARSAPRTLCHLDVWPMNLIDAGAGAPADPAARTSVLLDWAFVGDGAVGEDVANLVIDAVADGLIDAALFPEIAETVVAGFLEGLADGGTTVGADEVLQAIAATGAAKYSWLAPAMVTRAARTDTISRGSYGVHTGVEDLFTARIGLLSRIADWAEPLLGPA